MNDANDCAKLQAALAHHTAGRLDEADALYRQILASKPDDARLLHLRGIIAMTRGSASEAISSLGRAARISPASVSVHIDLARALHAAGRYTQAGERYRQALTIDPEHADGWHGLAATLATAGQTEEAVQALRRAVALQPGHVAALWDLAAAGQGGETHALEAILVRADLGPAERINAEFALAATLDQTGRYDEAFRHLHAANQLIRARMEAAGTNFDAAALRAYVDGRIAAYTAEFFATRRGWGNTSEQPVFIVGMMRSGSTLTEQILASHPRIFGIGEANLIGAVDAELRNGVSNTAHCDWTPEICHRAADAHIARLRVMGGGALRVIDKTLDNLFHLGMIAVLFPGARVIVCRRDPRDVAVSCYFRSFVEPVPYAYDLADCATRIREVDRMLAHWQAVLPLPMHIVQYERLVAEPEKESRRLIAFLGLNWDVHCLEFHRTQRPVRSASLWQVRRPLYGDSVGRWRNYMPHIGPLLDVFGRD